jgi:lipid II isoglutaminyl synthase (glutamine-hydrolysing)
MSQTLRIAHLYPDHMNIYGDRGNIIALRQRCLWRGIAAEILPIGPGATVDWGAIDIAFFGGGQDSGQSLIAEDFVVRQGPGLRQAIDQGLVLLAICGGYQLLGHYFLTHTGEKLPGIGALDLHTVGGDVRLIGNVVVEVDLSELGGRQIPPAPTQLVGFENHSGRTYLGAGARSFGTVLRGHGNNGEDRTAGALYQNTIGCYLHGSLLPKNPQLTDALIDTAIQRRLGSGGALTALDDTIELAAQRSMVARILA